MDDSKDKITPEAVEKAQEIVNKLRDGGEVGLAHLGALSSVIERPIKVLEQTGTVKYIIAKEIKGELITVQYHGPNCNNPGHWTLPGGAEPVRFENTGPNNCLFNVVAEQTGMDPNKLRLETLRKMEEDFEQLALQIDNIEKLQKSKSLILVFGGCPQYRGRSPEDAARVLNNSQGVRPHQFGSPGHPRGHVSNPRSNGPTDSIEQYSRSGEKSGFYLIHDQDYVTHYALLLPIAQSAMNKLNNGSNREVIHIPHHEFKSNIELPNMGTWANGERNGGPFRIDQVTMVLGHHQNEAGNPEADVHIQTCYPRK